MKKQYWIGLIAMVAIAFGVGQATAQDEGEEKAAAGQAMPPWFAKSKQHADLAKSVGDFDVLTEFWMAPDQPPQKAPATATRKLILNGYYVEEVYKLAMPSGMFEGRMTLGYDVVRKKYVHSWVDNSVSTMSMAYGTEKDGVLTFAADDLDRNTGKIVKTKSTLKVESADKWVMSMFNVTDKGDVPTMRLTYTRKK